MWSGSSVYLIKWPLSVHPMRLIVDSCNHLKLKLIAHMKLSLLLMRTPEKTAVKPCL